MILQAKNLHHRFSQGEQEIHILSELSFELGERETLAISGRSGAGKSTLLSLLAGLTPVQQGELYFAERPMHQLSTSELSRLRAQSMGIVFQHYHLLDHLKAWENVALPAQILGHREVEKKARQLLEEVQLAPRAEHFPWQLSGGERQRVALARALITAPRLILADEPSGNLDEDTGRGVMDLLFELVKAEQRALVLVTHDATLARRCGRHLQLDHGALHAVVA